MYARSQTPHPNHPSRPILKSSNDWTPPATPIFGPQVSHFCHASEGHHQRHLVHFPPSPSLTRTAPTFSAASYDRSPIIVTNNDCALPERGCPGRTYVISECKAKKAAARSAEWMEAVAHHGLHRHPSALISAFGQSHSQAQLDEDDTSASSSSPSEPEESYNDIYDANDTLRFPRMAACSSWSTTAAASYTPLFPSLPQQLEEKPKKQRKTKSCLERYMSFSSSSSDGGDGCLGGF